MLVIFFTGKNSTSQGFNVFDANVVFVQLNALLIVIKINNVHLTYMVQYRINLESH